MAPKAAPPKVPESVLKKRKTLEKIKADRAEKALAIKKASKVSRKAIFKKAEQYVKEYKNMEKALINSRRQAKQFGNYFVEPEPKLLFVTRIRGINKMPPQPRKILDLLRLREIHTVGPNFKSASNFLWPFKLSSPTGGYSQRGISFTEGGDYGNRDGKINALVRQMN